MRETMKATSSSSSFAVYITLCITAVVHISYGDSRETCQPCPVTTTPPIDHVLPLERKAANHIDLICPASEKCGKVFLHGFVFNVTCNDGYTFGKFDGSPVFTLFVNGTWTPTVPECKRMCKPLKNVRCRYKREEINCSNSVPVGTEATCRTGHMPGPSVVCKENGQWSYDLEDCPTTGMCKPLKNVRCRYKGEEINCSNSVPVGTEATCKTGHMPGPSVVCKENGRWNYDLEDCPTTGMCKPLKNVRCRYKGEEIECSNSVPVGTEATCKTEHMPARTSVVCKENGQWSYDLVDCPTSACGRKNSSESISPWFFAILIRDPPILLCMGTLVSPHMVLTSARCVFLNDERSVRSPETLKVIAGNQWLNKKPHGATVGVRHISMHPLYFGFLTHYAANVALIDLESSVPFTPACVDWDLKFAIAERESASITIIDDSTLQEVVVQCESYVNCASALETVKRHYLTHDKFCVKFSNDTDKFVHYSSGLVVQRNGVSYVKGVVSHYFNSNVGRKYVATNLSDVGLIHWLRQTKLSFDAHHIDN